MEAFAWLAILGKVSTMDNLRRRGLASGAISNLCVLGRKEMETVDHLFIHCQFSHTLWCSFLLRCVVLWCSLGTLVGTIEAWSCSRFYRCELDLGDLYLLISYGVFGKSGMTKCLKGLHRRWRA